MTGERDCSYRRSAVASTDVVDGVLEPGGQPDGRTAGRAFPMFGCFNNDVYVSRSARPPVRLSARPQLQLGFLFRHTIERKRNRTYRQTPGVSQDKSAASGIGELSVERCGRERYRTRAGCVIGICRFDQEPVCGESALSEPPAEPLREQTEQGKKDSEVVGICCERVAHVKLRLPLRW